MEQLSIFDLGVESIHTERTSEKIIRASELKVIKIESFLYTAGIWKFKDGSWHVIGATIAYLENNMVYLRDFAFYPFLYTFDSEQKAYKFYMENLYRLRNHGKGKDEIHAEINIHNEFKDMYYCDKNIYGCFEYWNNNFNSENRIIDKLKQL